MYAVSKSGSIASSPAEATTAHGWNAPSRLGAYKRQGDAPTHDEMCDDSCHVPTFYHLGSVLSQTSISGVSPSREDYALVLRFCV